MTETPIFDEMWGNDGQLRAPYGRFQNWLESEDPKRLRAKQREADDLFRLSGITFNVYGRSDAEERLIPFDIIPRIISAREWQRLSRGIEQRVRAINAFLFDIYNGQEIIKAGRLPREMIAQNGAGGTAGIAPGEGNILYPGLAVAWAGHLCATAAPNRARLLRSCRCLMSLVVLPRAPCRWLWRGRAVT